MKNSVSFFRLMCIYNIDIQMMDEELLTIVIVTYNEEKNINAYKCICGGSSWNGYKWEDNIRPRN